MGLLAVFEKTFMKCGQHIWKQDQSSFESFMLELSEDSVYKALLANAQAVELEGTAVWRLANRIHSACIVEYTK